MGNNQIVMRIALLLRVPPHFLFEEPDAPSN